MILAAKMTDRDDRNIRGHLLPWMSSIREAAAKMECSETTIRRAIARLGDYRGYVALVNAGCSDPACCIDR